MSIENYLNEIGLEGFFGPNKERAKQYAELYDNCLGQYELEDHPKKYNASMLIDIANKNNKPELIKLLIENRYRNSEKILSFINKYHLVPIIVKGTNDYFWYSFDNKRLYNESHGASWGPFNEDKYYENLDVYLKSLEED